MAEMEATLHSNQAKLWHSFEVITAIGDTRVSLGLNQHIGSLKFEALARLHPDPETLDLREYTVVTEGGDPKPDDFTVGGWIAGGHGETVRLEANPSGGI